MKRSTLSSCVPCFCLAAFLFALFASGCSTLMPDEHARNYEQLERIMRLYNNEFESRSDRAGAMWVKDEFKGQYLTQVKEIQDRVNFVNSQIISVTFSKAGKPIAQSESRPQMDFDEALVLNRYEYVVSPSVSLKTRTIEQRWVLIGSGWKLIPNLSAFFK